MKYVVLTEATVTSFWDGSHSGTPEQCLRALCVSHERLRAEAHGLDVFLEEANRKLAAALALTDTGSAEFRKAFPATFAAAALFPCDHVPGWRVVEAIREILNG